MIQQRNKRTSSNKVKGNGERKKTGGLLYSHSIKIATRIYVLDILPCKHVILSKMHSSQAYNTGCTDKVIFLKRCSSADIFYCFDQGTQIWSSPKQEMKLVQVITLPQHNLVVTRDFSGTIKLWQGDTGKELGAFSAESTFCPTVAYTINNKLFLSVSLTSFLLP